MTVDVAVQGDCIPLTGLPARIVVVDDHLMIRMGLRAALDAEPDFEVCGEAPDGLTGTEVALRERPDVVLMDIAMPGIDGIEATSSIVAGWPEAKVLMLTAFSDVRLVRAALGAGAYGYVLKDADPRSVICSVRKALRGVRPMSAEITEPLAGG